MRSGVRLKSIGGGHADLNMVISELKDMRQAAKVFMAAQNSAAQDMVKWAAADENRAIQDIMSQLAELNTLWTDVQRDFIEQLKVFKHQFEMILEGERQVDQARTHLLSCEQKELKIRKELKRAAKKATVDEINNLEIKLSQAERAKDLAQLEVVERVHENEAVKLIRIKEGLLKLSDAYVELANKSAIIFEAQREITHQLPDIDGRDLHEIKYTGTGVTKHTVIKARDKVQQYHRLSYKLVPTSNLEDPPPPYSPAQYHPLTGHPYEDDNRYASQAAVIQRQRAMAPAPQPPTCPSPITNERDSNVSSFYSNSWSADVRWDSSNNYEEDISEAMGAAKI